MYLLTNGRVITRDEGGKGFIDMKPLAGGAIEDGRLALRYVLSNPAVTVSIPGMATVEELNANVAGAANTAPLTPEAGDL